MNLSKHFALNEMRVSQEAARLGIPNEPDLESIKNLSRLCALVLEPLREACKRPIIVSSGYRSTTINARIGGANFSDHTVGRAADITIPGMTPFEVCQMANDLGLPFKQCILEFDAWTHLSIGDPEFTPRRELLTARIEYGKTAYLRGLIA